VTVPPPGTGAPEHDPRLLAVLAGLVESATAGCPDVALFRAMCEAVRDRAGVPLARSALQMENLHPVYYGYCLHWEAGVGARLVERSREFGASEAFRLSPYMASLRRGGWRWRATDGDQPDLPLVQELAASGVTDFLAEIVGAVGALPPGITWATRAPGGFSAADAALLRALGPHLVPLFGVGAERRKLEAVLRTYLGTAPGREVLGGQIQRGDVRRLEAVVLLTDLRGFTAMAASGPEALLLATLDRYFEAVADAVQAQGGEVLKFIGDGVLSVFPADRAPAAVAAARAALAVGGPPFTAVLTSGPVVYGNIGARERLDFTVIGPAVNLASRIEAVAKRLDETLVATAEVAGAAGERGRALGRHELRGVAGQVGLVAL
jgi:adenylate cyclase